MMTRRRRWTSALTACAALALVLGSVAAPRAVAAHRAASKVTINWWWVLPNMDPLVKSFERSHPDITVKVTVYPNGGDDSQGKMLAAIAGHHSPDVVLAWDDSVAGWAAKGEIQPLDSYLNQLGVSPSAYVHPAWQSVTWQNQVYGVPAGWDPDSLLWYNKKVFKAAGLDPNKPPTTWAEFTADAAKIDLIQGGKVQRVGIAPWDGWVFNTVEFGHLFGADLQDGASKTIKLDQPAMRAELTWEGAIAKKFGGASKINSFTTVQNAVGMQANPLIAGREGMQLVGTWMIPIAKGVLNSAQLAQTLGIAAVPAPPGGHPYLSHSGWSFMIPRGAPHADAARQFVQWVSQPSHIVQVTNLNGWIAARLAARSAKMYQDPLWQQVFAVNKKAGEGYWLLPSPVEAPYYKALMTAEQQVINLKQTPQQALAEAQKVAQQALQDAIAAGNYGD